MQKLSGRSEHKVRSGSNSLGKYSILESFPLAKFAAKLLTARKIATYVAILGSHPAIRAAKGILPQAPSRAAPAHGCGSAPQPTDAVLHPAHISRASGDVAGLFATSPLARLHWFVNHRFPWVGTHG